MNPVIQTNLYRLLLLVTFLGLWEYGSGRTLDPFYFSSPSAIAILLTKEFVDPGFYNDFYVTAMELVLGFSSGAILGVLTGLFLGRYEALASVLEPFFVALNSIPRIALAPLFVIWFGIDMTSKVVLAASLVYFLTFFNTIAGVRSVDVGLVNVARVVGAADRQIFMKVVLPSAFSWIMTGLKLSLPFALIGVIVGEFLAASQGLGYRLNLYSTSYNTTGTLAMLVVMMVFMLLLNHAMERITRRLLNWQPQTAFSLQV